MQVVPISCCHIAAKGGGLRIGGVQAAGALPSHSGWFLWVVGIVPVGFGDVWDTIRRAAVLVVRL